MKQPKPGALLDQYLETIGLKRKPIPRDGLCLFRAVSEQVTLVRFILYMRKQASRLLVLGGSNSLSVYVEPSIKPFNNLPLGVVVETS